MGYTAAPLEKLIEEFSKFPKMPPHWREPFRVPTPSSIAAVSARIIQKRISAPSVPVQNATLL